MSDPISPAPEDTKLSRASALLFTVGIGLLIVAGLLKGWLNRGAPDGAPWPGPTYPIIAAGAAALVAGVIAFVVYAVRYGPKKQK